ncbi:hypothetical protein M422DRAFT_272768 [Sphaerobolus stellatus SS14]|uniref:Uncharacterized protein n=1 Tax=Sphaerobolus stellatus (strain SS14) TaxID=990650 RepID=A0A0C9UAS7_SPHS4|nr:hypothetical protein M422DRAFT_272768 [Sphaerobolus stellatus SS14]
MALISLLVSRRPAPASSSPFRLPISTPPSSFTPSIVQTPVPQTSTAYNSTSTANNQTPASTPSTAEKRTHDGVEAGNHNDQAPDELMLTSTYRKKPKNDPTEEEEQKLRDIQREWGRKLAGMVDAFSVPGHIFAVGIKFENAKNAGEIPTEDSVAPEHRALLNSYQLFMEHIVELDTYIAEIGQVTDAPLQQRLMKDLYIYLRNGQDASRNDDTAVIKDGIVAMLRSEFPTECEGLKKKDKSNRGFIHHLTARLLTPPGVDFTDTVSAKDIESGKIPRDPEDTPLFLYENYYCNPFDEFEGFLKSPLLTKAFKAIYIGPSSWDPDDPSKSKRSSKASIGNMQKVTGRTITYIAMLVHFVLSDDLTLNKEASPGSFDYGAFFWNITSFFEDKELADLAAETLQWWNT